MLPTENFIAQKLLLTHIVFMNRILTFFISRPTCSTINSYPSLKKIHFRTQFLATKKLTKIVHLTNYTFLPSPTHVIQPKIKIMHSPLHSYEMHV